MITHFRCSGCKDLIPLDQREEHKADCKPNK